MDVPEDRKFVGLEAYQKAIDCDVDMVLLCTPPGFRPAQFRAAVEAGKTCLHGEASGRRRARRPQGPGRQRNGQKERARGRRRTSPATRNQAHRGRSSRSTTAPLATCMFMRAYFNTGAHLGPPRTAEADRKCSTRCNNWYHFNWLSGDHIVEQHVHDLDVCNWMVNDHPVEAQSLAGRQKRDDNDYGEIYDHHAVEFTYPNGVKLFSYCRQIGGCWGSFSEHAHGTNGTVNIEGHGTSVIHVKGQEPLKAQTRQGRTPGGTRSLVRSVAGGPAVQRSRLQCRTAR